MNKKVDVDKHSYLSNANPAFIEQLYKQYQEDPESVELGWRNFFEGYELASSTGSALSTAVLGSSQSKDVAVMKLINAYRARGHLIAKTNPVRPRRAHKADLNLDYFGLNDSDLDIEFDLGKQIHMGRAKLSEILAHLQTTYCGSIGSEYRNIRDSRVRIWLHEYMEPIANKPNYSKEKRIRILKSLAEAVGFEKFLGVKYVGQKRFSLEGCESFIPALERIFDLGADLGIEDYVMGMAHRGRLNVLVNIFGKSYEDMFTEFDANFMPSESSGDGDVKYHQGHAADLINENGLEYHVSLAFNPSHLEAVDPVVLGLTKAKGERQYEGDKTKICPILVHGDAAISGQGVIYEIANMSKLDGYDVGGTVHIVINNQVGFTANYRETRSSLYCTDIAKVTESPVFHVNADDVEAVIHVAEIAIKLRQIFGIDVYIDLLGYRRYGHNEGDDPQFTQPILYEFIGKHKSVIDLYVEQLIDEKFIDKEESKQITSDFRKLLDEHFKGAKDNEGGFQPPYMGRIWTKYRRAIREDFDVSPKTGVSKRKLNEVLDALITVPEGINIYPKMRRIIDYRKKLGIDVQKVDWGLAELMAYGSLLIENVPIRLSGQDAARGTFAHRHSAWIDFTDETRYLPLNHIRQKQERFQVYNSHLSEYAVMGFEYGYSLAIPNGLTIWEAQFGDFVNGAQIIIDQFLSSSESKWQRMSGLVLFLPHGNEGQGPEHSSARLGRFLDLCGELNIIVCNPTTSANLFHMIRRQMTYPFRKPLIVMTPKGFLRDERAQSDYRDLIKGKFQETIIDDDDVATTKRLILCSGKVYYELDAYKDEHKITDVAIVRIEQFYPIPHKQDLELKATYKNAQWVWVQEEPVNMGARQFILDRFSDVELDVVSRPESASPAPGASAIHKADQKSLIERAFDKSS